MLLKIIFSLSIFMSLNTFADDCPERFADAVAQNKAVCLGSGPDECLKSYDTVVDRYMEVKYLKVRCWWTCEGNPHDGPWHASDVIICDPKVSDATQVISKKNHSNKICGSIVDVENRVVGESIPLVGASFSLNYFSDWTYGRSGEYTIKIPLVGDTSRDGIDSFSVEISSGGTIVSSANYTNNQTNLNHFYSWDGKNSLGQLINGTKKFKVLINEVYPTITIPIPYELNIGGFRSGFLGLGSWLPSNFAYYDFVSESLHKADGSVRNVKAKPMGSSEHYVAEEDGSLVYVFNSLGNIKYTKTGLTGQVIYTFNYDSAGRLASIAEPFGRITTFHRNFSGDFESITAPKGQITLVTLDSNGFLSSVEDPQGITYLMTYSSAGLLESFQKPAGQISTFEYDSEGLLVKDSHSGGYFFELVAALNSSVPSDIYTETTMGRKTTYQTQSFQSPSYTNKLKILPTGSQETEQISEDTSSKFYSFNTGNEYGSSYYSVHPRFPEMAFVPQQKSMSNGAGSRSIAYTFDTQLSDPDDPFSVIGITSTVSDMGSNFSVVTGFNPQTRKFLSTTSLGRTAETDIDQYERAIAHKIGNIDTINLNYTNEYLMSIVQGTRSTSFAYNTGSGNLQGFTNPLNQTTLFVHDNSNRITAKILPDSRTISFGYDSNGNVISVTPPNRPAHYFSVNGHELVGSYAPPALSGVSVVNTLYSYNLDKQLTQVTRPDGAVIDYNYNATTGVLENFVTPDGTYTLTMDYSNGLPSSIVTADGYQTQISYAGRAMIGSTVYDSAWGMIGTYTPTFTNMLVQSDSATGGDWNASQVNYAYDDDENLTGAGDLTLAYNVPNGQLTGTSITSGSNTITDVYTYNTYGEVTGYEAKLGTTTIYSLNLPRDASGRINGKTQTMSSTTDAYEYAFDLAGRLTETKKNSVVVATYAYDSNSNRNGGTIGSQPTTATYDDQDRLGTYNTLSFTYNANGDLLTKTNNTLSQTTQYVYDVFGNLKQVTLPNTTVISYEIDGLNRRVGRKVNGVLDRRWIYMDQYRIAAETDASGVITKRFVYGSKGNIPDYMISGGENYRIISDHLGSPRLVIKVSDGTIVHQMNHDEFGRVTQDTNPGYLPFGFAGGLYDTQTGLVRFGARDYDPEVGRWTAKDPILFNGMDGNLYGYTFNDPVNFIDINGLWSLSISGYAIFGGGILIGQNKDGSWFGTARFGIGKGFGASWDKHGEAPSGNSCKGISTGAFAEAGVLFGPFELAVGTNSGFSQFGGPYATPPTPSGNLTTNRIKVGIGYAGGFEISFQ